MSLAAAAAASLLYYAWYQQQEKVPEQKKAAKTLEGDDEINNSRSIDTENDSVATAKSANISPAKTLDDGKIDHAALHAKIEELDKKGKAFFRNKQVRHVLHVVCVCVYSWYRCEISDS